MLSHYNEKRGLTEGDSGRGLPRSGHEAEGEDFARALTGESSAAHERAVITVKLTLLLMFAGVILFLFAGVGRAYALLQRRDGLVEYHR